MSFTTTFVGKAKEFAGVAGKKANELTARAKTNLSMIDVETDLENLYKSLGKVVYRSSKTEGDAEAAEKAEELISKIDEKQALLADLRARSLELRRIKICDCGKENPSDSEFCSKCGAKLD